MITAVSWIRTVAVLLALGMLGMTVGACGDDEEGSDLLDEPSVGSVPQMTPEIVESSIEGLPFRAQVEGVELQGALHAYKGRAVDDKGHDVYFSISICSPDPDSDAPCELARLTGVKGGASYYDTWGFRSDVGGTRDQTLKEELAATRLASTINLSLCKAVGEEPPC